jgi:hypothetical protein
VAVESAKGQPLKPLARVTNQRRFEGPEERARSVPKYRSAGSRSGARTGNEAALKASLLLSPTRRYLAANERRFRLPEPRRDSQLNSYYSIPAAAAVAAAAVKEIGTKIDARAARFTLARSAGSGLYRRGTRVYKRGALFVTISGDDAALRPTKAASRWFTAARQGVRRRRGKPADPE